MRQVQQNLNSLADDVVALVTADAGYEPDPASIMLVRGVVEALGGWQSIRVETGHHGLRPVDLVPFASIVLGLASLSDEGGTLLLRNRNSIFFNNVEWRAKYNPEFR